MEPARPPSADAILDAAWDLFAHRGPAGASVRQVAEAAGCTHALIARHFGSKAGLAAAVADRLVDRCARTVDEAWASEDPLASLLQAARRDEACARLVVRAGLGDLDAQVLPERFGIERLVAAASAGGGEDRHARLAAYATASLLLGWITAEPFVVAGSALGPVPPPARDRAIAAVGHRLLAAGGDGTQLTPRRLPAAPATPPPGADTDAPPSAREALLAAAIERFVSDGPAAVSVRAVARHAGVNQGLVHRHFGSKAGLLTEALERANAALFPVALDTAGFDIDAIVALLHHDQAGLRLIARTIVDDIEITSVRPRFPVQQQLLDAYAHVPDGPALDRPTDPRVAVAAASALVIGSAIWRPQLSGLVGLADDPGLESAIADLARVVLAAAPGLRTGPGGTR